MVDVNFKHSGEEELKNEDEESELDLIVDNDDNSQNIGRSMKEIMSIYND